MDVKNCIFCGARPLSKEHIWSKWTYELFPQRSDWRHERVVFKSSPDDRIARLAANRSFQGDVSTVKVRAVCAEKCNNGWMSRLEARAKPVLTKLISGSACRLTTNDQELIAAWISMKVLVLEFGTSVGPISSAENRTRVMTHAVPPPRWHIWIAMHEAKQWRSGFMRNAAGVTLVPKGAPRPPRLEGPQNTQFILLGIGHLLFVIFSSHVVENISLPNHYRASLRKIHPVAKEVIWPPLQLLRDIEIEDHLAAVFTNFLDGMEWIPGV